MLPVTSARMARRPVPADGWGEALESLPREFLLKPAQGCYGEGIRVLRRFKNMRTHLKLVEAATDLFNRAGYSDIIHTLMPVETNSHQCGTLRFGDDPTTSVLDPYCKAWDVDNLYVVDASFFPSSTAMNPALTIVAQALRVGSRII